MSEDYLQWHAGLRFERGERRFRPYVERNDGSGERVYAAAEYEGRDEAAVAASDLLEALREGRAVDTAAGTALGEGDHTHERLPAG